ncbi:unnamed protein product, partial [Rotaria sp. Silwood2]
IERDIDRFNDIFHQYGDDMDEERDPNVDFDNLYMNIGKDNDNNDNNTDVFEIQQLNDDKNILVDLTAEVVEEEHLSQKLSQLSATDIEQEDSDKFKPSTIKKRPALTPTTTTGNITKKMKSNEEEQSNRMMPRYLSSNNKVFEQVISPVLQKTR